MIPMTVEHLKDLGSRFPEAGFLRCRKAFEASDGDVDRAALLLAAQGHASAEEVARRPPLQGHTSSSTVNGVTVKLDLRCETKAVATSPAFLTLADGLAMHVATSARSMDMGEMPTMFQDQPYVFDPTRTVGEVLTALSEAVGEKVFVSGYRVDYAWVEERILSEKLL